MTETDLYEQIAEYLNIKYPKVIYHFDLSGVFNPSHKTRNLYSRLQARAWPDLFIAQISSDVRHAGLFIELKRDGTALYRKDGTLRANTHHAEQSAVLEALRSSGYKAEFAVGFDQAVNLIDDYLLHY